MTVSTSSKAKKKKTCVEVCRNLFPHEKYYNSLRNHDVN